MAKPNYVSVEELKRVLPTDEQDKALDDSVSGSSDDPQRDPELAKYFLKAAESRVEFYLSNYSLPLSDPPFAIKHAVLVVATYLIFQRSDLEVSDEVQETYDNVIQWLSKISREEINLPNTNPDDADFVGFGDKSNMTWDSFPFSDFKDIYF